MQIVQYHQAEIYPQSTLPGTRVMSLERKIVPQNHSIPLCIFLLPTPQHFYPPTSPAALENGSLHSSLVEYLDGARQCLEVEAEKDAPATRELRQAFADLVTELIKSFQCKYTALTGGERVSGGDAPNYLLLNGSLMSPSVILKYI